MTEQPKSIIDHILFNSGNITRLAIGITIICLIYWWGITISEYINEGAKETREYCDAHPEVELWGNKWGITNCTAWREDKVVTLV